MMLDVVLRREADAFHVERAEVTDAPGAPPRFGGIGRWSSYDDDRRDHADRQFPKFSALLDAVEGAAGTLERFLVANPSLRDDKYRQRTPDKTWALALFGPDESGRTGCRTEY